MTEARTDTEPRDVAVRQDFDGLDLPAQKILAITTSGEVERVEQSVILPPIYQYSINRYPAGQRVMLTSDAYDYINRVMGVQLYQPKYVHDEHGQQQLNPIHRPDYIYLRVVGIWRNDAGQMVSYQEDVEVDFKLTYQDSRINAKSMRVVTDKDGAPVMTEGGIPKIVLDADDEKKALKALSQLRTFGLRYAQTVAKTRILKTASGIRQLPIQTPRPFAVRVVGFRDNLTPEERLRRAETDMAAMFGPSAKIEDGAGLTPDEFALVRDLDSDVTEDIERELVNAAVEESVDSHSNVMDSMDAPIRRVGPDAEWDLGAIDAEAEEQQKPDRKRKS